MVAVASAAVRVGVLASGGGSNLEAILEAGIAVEVVVVDRPCGATAIAERHGVPAVLVERESFGPDFDRTAYTERVVDVLVGHGIELVVMAGFMTVFDKPIFDAFDGRILNTHPALLPAFKGAHAVRDALAFGVKVTGCTVHVATMELDDGPILAQEAVPVLPGDDVDSLHERIKVAEREMLVTCVGRMAREGFTITDRKVRFGT